MKKGRAQALRGSRTEFRRVRQASRARDYASEEWQAWLEGLAQTNDLFRKHDIDLTATRQAVFYRVGLCDGILQKRLKKWVGRSGASLTRNLDVLEELGLANRRRNPNNRRENQVWLTDWGRRTLDDLRKVLVRVPVSNGAAPCSANAQSSERSPSTRRATRSIRRGAN